MELQTGRAYIVCVSGLQLHFLHEFWNLNIVFYDQDNGFYGGINMISQNYFYILKLLGRDIWLTKHFHL